jgi:acyl dehydratase
MLLKASELHVGYFHEQIVVDRLTRTQMVQYAGASGDYNPLHTDEVYAVQMAGYPSVIADGMLTMGMVAHMVTDFVGDGRLTELGGRFLRPVWPGDTLSARGEVVNLWRFGDKSFVELALSAVNQDDAAVFAGRAVAIIDG